MATSLVNKVMDVGFALIMFRILQAEGVGAYTFAGVLVGYFDILVGFGLGTLITREVARSRERAGEILGNTLVARLALWGLSAGAAAVLTGPGAEALAITPPIALTIWLLLLAVLPGIVSSALTCLLQGYERMELPALVTVATTALKVTLGVLVLLAGFGYVGLAAVALINNMVTALVLAALFVRVAHWPRPRVSGGMIWWMAGISLPLMLNDLLNSLFFRIDAILLKPMAGDAALGWYSTAYKFIDGLQIIPASFVLAVFPLMARQAHEDRQKLADAVRLSLSFGC
jgi:O-antigen/teichoic acid export membrane protein